MQKYKEVTVVAANSLRDAIRSASRENALAAYTLCGLLHQALYNRLVQGGKVSPLWPLWGYREFDDFAEKEVGLHGNTARDYVAVFQKFGIDCFGKWDMDDLLPITKMRTLARCPMVNPKTCDSWLKRAAKMTCCALDAEVHGSAPCKHFSLALSATQHRALMRALDFAREEHDEDRASALARITSEWLDRNKPKLRKVS